MPSRARIVTRRLILAGHRLAAIFSGGRLRRIYRELKHQEKENKDASKADKTTVEPKGRGDLD